MTWCQVVSEVDDEVYDTKGLAKDVVTFTPDEEKKLEVRRHHLSGTHHRSTTTVHTSMMTSFPRPPIALVAKARAPN